MPGEISSVPKRAAALVAILWFAGITWWLAIPAGPGYSFDDREAIVGNPVVEGSLPLGAAFDRDYWHHLGDAGHYRPLATVALRLDASRVDVRAKEAPLAFRWTNLALHLSVVLLLGLALIRLERAGGPLFPWFGLALFAVHPASADAVAWISGRTSLISALGAALGLALLSVSHGAGARPWLARGLGMAAGLLGALVALLAKEDGLVIAAALPVVAAAWPAGSTCPAGSIVPTGSQQHEFVSPAARIRRALPTFAGATLAVLIAGWLRHMALGSALPAAPSAPLAAVPWIERLAIGCSAWWQGLNSALLPWTYAPPSLSLGDILGAGGEARFDSPMGTLLFGDGVPGFGLGGAVALLTLAGWLLRRAPGARLSLMLSGLAVIPLVQIIPAGELFAPRFLYQPLLLGVVWTGALATTLLRPLGRHGSPAVQIALLILFASSSIHRAAPVYDTRESYWRAHFPAHEREAQAWNALGEALRERGDLDGARDHFATSSELDPRYSRPLANLGALEARAGHLEAAESWFEQAILEGRLESAPRGNLATILLRQGRAEEALDYYRDAARLSPGRATYHRGMARAALALDDLDTAREAARRAMELAPTDRLTLALFQDLKRAEADR